MSERRWSSSDCTLQRADFRITESSFSQLLGKRMIPATKVDKV